MPEPLSPRITRRDFLNGVLLGAGAGLLGLPAPLAVSVASGGDWDGYGGIGDYATSHGNTREVMEAGHRIRGAGANPWPEPEKTGELFDLVVVGGGFSGLGAAHRFTKETGGRKTCLILENHPIFGGEAKRNEFLVNGRRLMGPQGSNSFEVRADPGEPGAALYRELGLPTDFAYREPAASAQDLWFDRTNYGFMLWFAAPSSGHFFRQEDGGRWLRKLWQEGLAKTPYPAAARRDLRAWIEDPPRWAPAEGDRSRLDTMTYEEHLTRVLGLGSAPARFADPILASNLGLGSDAVSAYGAFQLGLPGFGRFRQLPGAEQKWHSFPGGNDGIARYFVKALIPAAIQGGSSLADIHNRRVHFAALDRPGQPVRMRLAATVLRVRQSEREVAITYRRGGRVYRLRARAAVLACGSWVSRNVVAGLPPAYQEAYRLFYRAPALVANVALTNWRFLHRLGLTACRWFKGFGFACNIRRPMLVGDFRQPLAPDEPVVLTFYVPFYFRGQSVRKQCLHGRRELLATSFRAYEGQIIAQMKELFGKAGFEPRRDVAGLILNRWGHAYLAPQPGFYFGRAGEPSPRQIVREPLGRIAFGHSEHMGHQHWLGAVSEGERAVRSLGEYVL